MEVAMFISSAVLLLLLSSIINGDAAAAAQDGGEGVDLASLLDFRKSITNDPSGAMSSWNATAAAHFCGWKGVTCDGQRRRVAALELAGLTLSGKISPSLGNMSFLSSLNLSGNLLSGQLPPQLGGLRRLVFLDLGGNLLQGSRMQITQKTEVHGNMKQQKFEKLYTRFPWNN